MNMQKILKVFILVLMFFTTNLTCASKYNIIFDTVPIRAKTKISLKPLLARKVKYYLLNGINKSINLYKTRKIKIKDPNIKNAIDDLINDITINPATEKSNRKITILFGLDKRYLEHLFGSPVYWTKSKKFKLKLSNFKGFKKNRLVDPNVPGPKKVYGDIDIMGETPGMTPNSIDKDVIVIKNGFYPVYSLKKMYYEQDDCRFEYVTGVKFPIVLPMGADNRPVWEWEKKEKRYPDFLLASTIFHELVHIALRDSSIENLSGPKGRWKDEATVEDIMEKIFAKASGGSIKYEYQYYWDLWWHLVFHGEKFIKDRPKQQNRDGGLI